MSISTQQLIIWKAAVYLESKGLKHSRGSVTATVKEKLGMNGSAADVHQALKLLIEDRIQLMTDMARDQESANETD